MLALGDPQGEVAFTHRIKERLRETYQQDNYQQASRMLNGLINTAGRASSPPEVQQLARTQPDGNHKSSPTSTRNSPTGQQKSINNLIKHIGYGFTNFTNHRTRILLYAGNPNWRPLNTIFP